MQLTATLRASTAIDASLRQKGFSLLVLLAVDTVEHFDHLLLVVQDSEAAKELLCSVLLVLTKLSAEHKATANVVTLQLLPVLERLTTRGELVQPDTDLWVSITLEKLLECLAYLIAAVF